MTQLHAVPSRSYLIWRLFRGAPTVLTLPLPSSRRRSYRIRTRSADRPDPGLPSRIALIERPSDQRTGSIRTVCYTAAACLYLLRKMVFADTSSKGISKSRVKDVAAPRKTANSCQLAIFAVLILRVLYGIVACFVVTAKFPKQPRLAILGSIQVSRYIYIEPAVLSVLLLIIEQAYNQINIGGSRCSRDPKKSWPTLFLQG